ncbi:MAG TPA: TetR family transcriptional regulator [Vicinamibacterales bacterium]|nr:TetR family transcriptional regulator [Vicinamibacterales bacterium]
MARPRKASDDEIFEAASRVMQRLGPAEWTLADIAAEAGLTAGALVQRFGSKRRLQVALLERFADAGPDSYRALRAQHRSPLGALRAYAAQVACLAPSREELAHHLDYLRLDLIDTDMHAHFRRHAAAGRQFIAAVLKEAVERGDLRKGTNVARLARLVDAVITGSLFTWAAHQEGKAPAWIRRNLDDLLAAYAPER